jgi:ribosomal protein S18 acetylase RimI-like enzyme
MDIYLNRPEQQDYHFVVCADERDRAAGYLCIGRRPMTRGTFDMYWIVTDPAWQGRGVGTALNSYAEEHVRAAGGTLLLAETSSKNAYEATRQFYLTRGYRELARIKDCYAVGDDLITYGKYFPQSE